MLVGSASPEPDGGTVVALDGGGEIASTARATGRVAASVYPWEISLDLPGVESRTSTRNHLPATVGSITALGGRVRVALEAPQPLTAEVKEASLRELGVRTGSAVIASWKAAATRLSPI